MTISWISLPANENASIKLIKSFLILNRIPVETQRHLKPVGTMPGIMYVSFKVHKKCVDVFPPFIPILSALQAPTYKLAKFLLPILEPLSTTKYTVKFEFKFATKIVEQDSSNFMCRLDIDSLSTNIPVKENIEIYTK